VAIIWLLLSHGADALRSFLKCVDRAVVSSSRDDVDDVDDDPYDDDDDNPMIVFDHLEHTVLHHAIESGNFIDCLLETLGHDIEHRDARGRKILHAACRSPFGPYADVSTKGGERFAPQTNGKSILQAVLDLGADVTAVNYQGKMHCISLQIIRRVDQS
jgi:ankyrin repeat protein